MSIPKSAILLILFCAVISQASAQEQSQINTDRAVKLYLNTSYDGTSQGDMVNLGHLSPSLSLQKPNGNFHEFELSSLSWKRDKNEVRFQQLNAYAGKCSEIHIGFRYEYNILLSRNTGYTGLSPYLGIAANPYYLHNQFDPIVSTAFPEYNDRIGIGLAIVPRLIYNFGTRWFMDVNIPLNIAEIGYNREKVANPTLPLDQRTTATIDILGVPAKYQVRIGGGIRF